MNDINFLQSAIQSGDKDRVEVLIKFHSNLVNRKDARGFTPLIYAAMYNQVTLVELLLKHGADKTITS